LVHIIQWITKLFSLIYVSSTYSFVTDSGRSQSDVRGSGGSVSQGGRGDTWQTQSRAPNLQDRGRDTGSKTFSRGQTGGLLKSKQFLMKEQLPDNNKWYMER